MILNMERSTGMESETAIIRKEVKYLCLINTLTSCLLNVSRMAAPEIITNVPSILFVSCMDSILLLEFPDLNEV